MWKALSLEKRYNLLECRSGMDIIERILNMPCEEKMKCVALLWCWWTERNKANHGERCMTMSELQYSVGMHTGEWKEFLQKNQGKTRCRFRPGNHRLSNGFSLTLTEPLFRKQERGGWGVVATDSDGDMVMAAAGSVPLALDALHTESVAMMQAIVMATRLGVGRVILATDCLALQTALTSQDYDLAQLGAMFREAKYLPQTSFIEYNIVYVPRACNKPAHTLAALGLAGVQNGHQEWLSTSLCM